jgi:hypothetical protein
MLFFLDLFNWQDLFFYSDNFNNPNDIFLIFIVLIIIAVLVFLKLFIFFYAICRHIVCMISPFFQSIIFFFYLQMLFFSLVLIFFFLFIIQPYLTFKQFFKKPFAFY